MGWTMTSIAVDDDIRIRSFTLDDCDDLVRFADNPRVPRFLRDVFPHPYTRRDARAWVRIASGSSPETDFALEVDGRCAGGIGLSLRRDIERFTAEIGFWLGEPFWNRGIATRAVRVFVERAFVAYGLERIEAAVFAGNPASARVLEKSGFVREGTRRRAACKGDAFHDLVMYGRLREDRS